MSDQEKQPTSPLAKEVTFSGVSFDEYKMYYESTEKVTDRRLSLNKANTSICFFVTAGIGAILGWSYDKKEVLPVALLIAIAISVLAILFCWWWSNQLQSYKILNTAKFEVLEEMAPLVVFAVTSAPAQSFLPFKREWQRVERLNGLQGFNGRFALKATRSELIIPVCFIVIYSIVIGVCAILFFTKRYYVEAIKFMF